LIGETGGIPGLRDDAGLDSALAAPMNRHQYESAGLVVCAVTYAFHLTRNHPFFDGNKRIGAAASEAFVLRNGKFLGATNDDIVALFLGIADGSVSRDAVEQHYFGWITDVTAPERRDGTG